MRVKKICQICGKEFEIINNQFEYLKRKTCSKKCRYLLIGKSREKRLILKCKICNKTFLATLSRINEGNKYCSHNCYAKSLENKIEFRCFHCDKIFMDARSAHLRYPEKKQSINIYCSKKCQYDSMRNNHGYINTKLIRTGWNTKCIQCGKIIYKAKYRLINKRHFCSSICYQKHEKKSIERKKIMKTYRIGPESNNDNYLRRWYSGRIFKNKNMSLMPEINKYLEAKILAHKIRRSLNV